MKIDTHSQLAFLRENFDEISGACQPLWHPLGFVSCIVRKEDREFVTRIHYWPKNERRAKSPNWPIHTHAYDLHSLILDGRVRDIQYRPKDGNDYAIYSVSYFGEHSTIHRMGRKMSIAKAIDEVHNSGEEYSVTVGSFHETRVPVDESAVTLVVQSNFVNDQPLVLGTVEEQCYRYNRSDFDRVLFWTRMRDVVGLI